MKLLFFDIESTGTKHWQHCIHQVAVMVVIDNVITETLCLRMAPHPKALIDEEALKAGGVTRSQIEAYPSATLQFDAFLGLLNHYIDPYNPEDKFFLCGYNNSWFDNEFLRNWFTLEGNDFFNTYFFSGCIDVMILATHYLSPDRHVMPSFKLHRTAKWLGIPVVEERLRDALYDVELTYEIYKRVKGKTINDDF